MTGAVSEECIFCRIAAGKVPAKIVYQDEEITAFWDGRPAAPVHILIIPNRHIPSANELEPADAEMLGRMILRAKEIAGEEGVAETGYRLFINTGPDGCQSVYHLHLHLMGGMRLPFFHSK